MLYVYFNSKIQEENKYRTRPEFSVYVYNDKTFKVAKYVDLKQLVDFGYWRAPRSSYFPKPGKHTFDEDFELISTSERPGFLIKDLLKNAPEFFI